MALSGSFKGSYKGWHIRTDWSATQSIANNTSTVTCNHYLDCDNYYSIYIGGRTNDSVIDGSGYTFSSPSISCNGSGAKSYYLGSTSKTIKHNADGSKSFSMSTTFYLKATLSGVYKEKISASSGTITLNSIPRQANLTSAPNFNDDGNPTIAYSNPAGNAATELVAAIYNDAGSVAYAGYRDISKTGSSYTFNLSTAERNALRNATPGSNTMTVRFYIRTNIGGNYYYSSIAKTLTINNPKPTLNPTVVDTNETTKALTGDANKLVKYYSNAYYTIGAAAVKGASLSSQKVTHNGSAKTSATGTYNGVQNASFAFEARDSRGNTTTKTITKSFVDYVKLTCNQDIDINTSGQATIKATGNYFNGSFGAVANTLTVQYRYKTQGGSYGSWTNMTASKSGNSFTAQATVSGFDYRTTYVFQCRAVDKLATINTKEVPFKALPVFDWGKDSFQFNVPVVFGAGFTQSAALTGDDVLEPTGDYVIEQGVAMVDGFVWQYRKWNGGSYECWGISQISTAVNTTWGALYVSGAIAATNKKFPITFAAVPNVNATLSANGAGAFLIASGSGTTTETQTGAFEIARGTASTSANTYKINYQVKGRWR